MYIYGGVYVRDMSKIMSAKELKDAYAKSRQHTLDVLTFLAQDNDRASYSLAPLDMSGEEHDNIVRIKGGWMPTKMLKTLISMDLHVVFNDNEIEIWETVV